MLDNLRDTMLEVLAEFCPQVLFANIALCFKVLFNYTLFSESCFSNYTVWLVEHCSCGCPPMKHLRETLAVDTSARHSCRIWFKTY